MYSFMILRILQAGISEEKKNIYTFRSRGMFPDSGSMLTTLDRIKTEVTRTVLFGSAGGDLRHYGEGWEGRTGVSVLQFKHELLFLLGEPLTETGLPV